MMCNFFKTYFHFEIRIAQKYIVFLAMKVKIFVQTAFLLNQEKKREERKLIFHKNFLTL